MNWSHWATVGAIVSFFALMTVVGYWVPEDALQALHLP